MSKMNFSSRVLTIFEEFQSDHEAMTSLMTDLALGREIYDAESERVVTKAEAEATVLDFSRKVLGITPEMIERKDRRAIERAYRDNKREWFDILEDTIDITLTVGLQQNEWFNSLAETINIGYGDRQDFVAEQKSYLAVATVGTSHHDHIMQRLKVGERYSIPTERHAVKVGADINKYILGQVEWDKFVAAIDEAYILDIQNKIMAAVDTAVSKLPAPTEFVGNGDLATNKAAFLTVTDNVADANGTTGVVVMGTRAALRNVMGIIDTNWISAQQKDDRADYGIVATAEGITLARIPNRYKDATFANGKVFDDKKLYIFATGDTNKFIKVVEEGGAYLDEVMDRSASTGYMQDIQSFEVQRIYGAGIVPGYVFGAWTLP